MSKPHSKKLMTDLGNAWYLNTWGSGWGCFYKDEAVPRYTGRTPYDALYAAWEKVIKKQ